MWTFQRGAPTMFSPPEAEKEAARARKLETIYHVGQQKIWDGRRVLDEALAHHPTPPGGERIGRREREALARVFSILMWGELAAWRVSAQLADLLPENEHRLAATSQAHDEARHYYVFHDYLQTLGVDVPPLDPYTRHFLNACLTTPHALNKVVGMQMFVETIALTIFKMVRKVNVDPALTEILGFYEQDEARHVGFGVQAAPSLMARAGRTGRISLLVFEARVLLAMLMALRNVEADLALVGVDVRQLLEDGGARFSRIVEDYRQEAGSTTPEGQFLARAYQAVLELVFPVDRGASTSARVKLALQAMQKNSPLA